MTELFLRRLSRWQAEDQRNDIADVHAEAYRDTPGAALHDRQDFLSRFAEHVQQPEFDLVLACAPAVVGCAYGFRIDRDGSWWDRFSQVPPELAELTSVANSRQLFVMAELMVRPAHRNHGVGGRLHDQLLARSSAPLAVTLLEPGNGMARSALQGWGWLHSGKLHPRGDTAPLEAWTFPLTR
ncbi:hypothetical protein [Streptomyces aidingensis]|uniref:Acetyltransferase (GNAT) family protein n=1 Tax=Streptomyces aidingensis TaxID=910347 RepID=A0A1I1TMT1_9ACTN|nr:hypothetical protein [Streptomyces aidingensis]SFD59986.1 hypothetical protein SAMN05421773_12054 [Streptomyces aidingensis]